MVLNSNCTAATATGDTTETSVGTIAFDGSANKLIGVGCYAIAGAALTTAESISGFFRFSITGKSLGTQKYPLYVGNILTSGTIHYELKIWPVSVSGISNQTMEFFVTHDLANTGALTARGFALYDETITA